jgi:hypothetical protein
MTLKQFAMKYPKLATVLICVAGFAFGNVAAILVAYGFTGHAPKESDLTVLGLTTGILFVTLARHCGILPAPEDADRPITLFPRDKPGRENRNT